MTNYNNKKAVCAILLCFCVLVVQGNEGVNDDQLIGATNASCSVTNCIICNTNPNSVCDQCDGDLIFVAPDCKCPQSFFNQTDVTCKSCIQNCLSCSSSSDCSQCQQGLFFQSNACVSCSSNCVKCSSSTVCLQCQDNYDLSNDACVGRSEGVGQTTQVGGAVIQCPTGCSGCSDATTCTGCIDGYYSQGNTCLKCHANCVTCNGGTASNCQSCPSSLLLEGGQCNSCADTNCITCEPSTICSLCRLGYGPSDGTCVLCSSNCLECSADVNVCTECQSGYGVVSGQCVECLAGCGVCEAADFTNCLSCTDGYFNSSNKCTLCPTQCSTCQSTTNCTACKTGFTLFSNQCFENCVFPCLTCANGQPSNCQSCYGGYSRSGNTCVTDSTCNGTSSCQFCSRGFYLSGGKCENCSLPNNCLKCDASNPSGCTQCDTGYYLSNDQCSRCNSTCTACTSSNVCTACIDGQFMQIVNGQQIGFCQACSSSAFCATCINSENQCTSCISGYSLRSSKCISDTRIVLVLVLNTDLAKFVLFINAFKLAFALSLGPPFSSNPQWITFTDINNGSIKLDATLTVPTNTSAEETKSDIEASLQNNNQYGTIPLLSAQSVTIESSEQEEPTTPPTQQASYNLPLILGLSIPLLLVAVSLILVCNLKGKTAEDEDEEDDIVESNSGLAEKL